MPRILFLLEDYNYFYTRECNKLLQQNSNFTYSDLVKNLIARKYYQSDGMASAFKEIGYETETIIPEANPLQLKWLKENNIKILVKWIIQKPIRSIKARFLGQHRTVFNAIQFETLLAQVKVYKPSVIYYYSNIVVTKQQVETLKETGAKLILQWTCPIWKEQPNFPYSSFDFIVTAAIQLKEYFSKQSIKVLYLQQAFDDTVLNNFNIKEITPKGDVVFIGSFTLGHHLRFEILEFLLRNNIDLTIHGLGKESLPEDSLVRKRMKEPLYGIEMYKEYASYKMAIHIHTTGNENDGIDWGKFAGAKRIFEITGSGTLLLTSDQENIKDLFLKDEEAVTFKNAEDLLSKINFYKQHPDLAKSIARKGMERTLNEHTFKARAKELEKALSN